MESLADENLDENLDDNSSISENDHDLKHKKPS